MAEYGVLLTTTSGEVWVTANSSPIALQARKTAALQGTSGFNTKVTHTFPAGQPVVAFVHCTVEVEITQTLSCDLLCKMLIIMFLIIIFMTCTHYCTHFSKKSSPETGSSVF